jgi:transcriptional regulator NrdR family protein
MPNKPSKYDLEPDEYGRPQPGRFVYQRRPLTAQDAEIHDNLFKEEADEFMAKYPLTSEAQSQLSSNIAAYLVAIKTRETTDSALHAVLVAATSPDSQAIVQLHEDYEGYINAPLHKRSLLYYFILRSIHRVGDASTKFKRTADFMQSLQGEMSLAEWINSTKKKAEQFRIDFQSDEHPGFIASAEIESFYFLHGSDRTRYKTVFDEILRHNSKGRFPRPEYLYRSFLQYDNSQKMSVSDPVSTQLTAFAAPGANHNQTDLSPAKPKSAKQRTACPHCAKRFPKAKPFYNHTPDKCANNPANLQAARMKTAMIAAQQSPPAQDDQSDRISRLETAIQSIASSINSPIPQKVAMLAANTTSSHDDVSARLASVEAAIHSIAIFLAGRDAQEE